MSGKILVADDLSLSRTILRAKLAAFCYETVTVENGEAAINAAKQHLPELILLDFHMPGIGGVAACKALRADPRTRDIPIFLYSASPSRAHCIEAFKAGADDFFSKPLNEALLMSRIRTLLRAAPQMHQWQGQSQNPMLRSFAEDALGYIPQGRLAILHPSDRMIADRFCTDLTTMRGFTSEVMTAESVLSLSEGQPHADLFLLTPEMIAQRGLSLISELKARKTTKDSMICAILPEDMSVQAPVVLDLGADEVMALPVDNEELQLRLNNALARKRRADRLRDMFDHELDLAIRDPLTGLFNRRYLKITLEKIMAQHATTPAKDFAVLMIDLDHFKTVNDRFGHSAGDEVLLKITQRLRALTRQDDILGRYGGEEFLLILPQATLKIAQTVAARICKSLADAPIRLNDRDTVLQVSASVGIAMASNHARGDTEATFAQIINAADTAMLRAKINGRDRFALAQDQMC